MSVRQYSWGLATGNCLVRLLNHGLTYKQ